MYLKVKTSTAGPEKCGYLLSLKPMVDFPGGPVEKNLPASAGDAGLISGLRRSSVVGNGNPLQDSCLENFRRAW